MSLRTLRLAALITVLGTVAAGAQTLRAPPVDEAARDPAFRAFRDGLLAAVVARDIDAILARTSPEIELTFGGHAGHADFRALLDPDPETFAEEYRHEIPRLREEYWAELETVLRLGGRFQEEGAVFLAPHTWTAEVPAELDPFATHFVIGAGVALRDRPIRWGRLLRRLNHDIVTVLDGAEGTPYARVRMADGATGYVHRDFLRAQIGYRAIFRRVDGRWLLETFIAGD